jgi:hypothetical protein
LEYDDDDVVVGDDKDNGGDGKDNVNDDCDCDLGGGGSGMIDVGMLDGCWDVGMISSPCGWMRINEILQIPHRSSTTVLY